MDGASAKWILVVEDDQDNRDVLVDLLDEAGYRARAVVGGGEALEVLRTSRPCLVLADFLLQDMDGKELRRRARELLGADVPPFVTLTGLAAAGLKDISGTILTKPIDVERLLGVVAEHCSA